jgi:hypothetical protein
MDPVFPKGSFEIENGIQSVLLFCSTLFLARLARLNRITFTSSLQRSVRQQTHHVLHVPAANLLRNTSLVTAKNRHIIFGNYLGFMRVSIYAVLRMAISMRRRSMLVLSHQSCKCLLALSTILMMWPYLLASLAALVVQFSWSSEVVVVE